MPDQIVPVHIAARATQPAGASFRCDYLTDCITVLSDGRVTCGLDDPFGTRNYGNIRDMSVREIFANAAIQQLRERLDAGHRCQTCHLYTEVRPGDPPPSPPPMPRRLIVETTIRCQLRCRNTTCDLNNDRAFKVREEPFLSVELFRKLIDEAGPHLGAMYFFNYGEPFLHPRAVDMLQYARDSNPTMIITTSTNGLLLGRGDAIERIVAGQLLDSINFTIAGYDDPSYQLYHKGGSFEQAFEAMRRLVEEKRRQQRSAPWVKWRYLLFNWNDSDEHIARVRELAREAGVDELRVMLCSTPLEGRSWRRAYGTPGFRAIQDLVEYEQHYRTDPFGDRGLYPPESEPVLGAHCWTSRRARLDVMPAGDRIILLLARQGVPAQHPTEAVLVTPWSRQRAAVGIDAWEMNVIPVPAMHRENPVTVHVETDEPYIAMRHGTSHDTREQGVMVSLAFAEPAVRPPSLEFPLMRHAPADIWVESAPKVVSGFPRVAPIAVLNGEYALDEGPYVSAPALVRAGQRVRVRHKTAGGAGLGRTTSLVIGGAISEFTSLTSPAAALSESRGDTAEGEADAQAGPTRSLGEVQLPLLVRQLYHDLLGREPDAQGLSWWLSQIGETGDPVRVAQALIESREFSERTAALGRVFLACKGGIPDYATLTAWIHRFWDGEPLGSIASTLMQNGEFVLRYGGLDDAAFVEHLQAEVTDPPRLALDPAKGSRVEHLLEICASGQCNSRLGSRVQVATIFVRMLRRRPDDSGWEFWNDQCASSGPRRLLEVAMGTQDYLRRFD